MICRTCGIVVSDMGKHLRRNRCKAQHIRAKDKAVKGHKKKGN